MKGIEARSDAERFVRNAQDVFNQQDLDGCLSVYSEKAELQLVTDGVVDTFQGKEEIYLAWKSIFTIFPDFRLTKTLMFYDQEVGLFNDWVGSMYGKRKSYGTDLWFIDSDGLVRKHKLITVSQLLPAEGLRGHVRWIIAHPFYAWRTLRVKQKLNI